jgi:hypothetical protein
MRSVSNSEITVVTQAGHPRRRSRQGARALSSASSGVLHGFDETSHRLLRTFTVSGTCPNHSEEEMDALPDLDGSAPCHL